MSTVPLLEPRKFATSKPFIGSVDDQDFCADLQIIARKEPGKGAALQRMLDRADCSHAALAEALGCHRTAVSHWITENRWPEDVTLRNALVALRIDRRLLLHYCGPVVTNDNEFDPKALAVAVFTSIFDESDPFERESIIYETLWEKALIAQGIKSASDTRAFVAFTEQKMRHEEEKRKRTVNTSRTVSPSQSSWSSGSQVYDGSSVTDSQASVTTPPDALTQAAALGRIPVT